MGPQAIIYLVVAGLAFLAGILGLFNFYIWYKEKHKKSGIDMIEEGEEEPMPKKKIKKCDLSNCNDRKLEENIVDRLHKNLSRTCPGKLCSSSQSEGSDSPKSVHMLFKPRPVLANVATPQTGYEVTL